MITDIFDRYQPALHGNFGIPEIMILKKGLEAKNIIEAMIGVGYREHEVQYIENYYNSSSDSVRNMQEATKHLGIGTQDKMTAAIAFLKKIAFLPSINSKYLNLRGLSDLNIPTRSANPSSVPIGKTEQAVFYAISDPNRIPELKQYIRSIPSVGDKEIIFALTIESVIAMLYRQNFCDTLLDLKKTIKEFNGENSRPVFESILIHSAFSRASDIHFTALPQGGIVEVRIDGVKSFVAAMNNSLYNSVQNLVMNSLGDPSFQIKTEGRLQEREIPEALKNRFEFRVEMMTEVYGKDMTIRLFDQGAETNDIESLGFKKEDVSYLSNLVKSGSGLIVVVGPTGSGKTTTNYALMKVIDPTRRSVQSVENPVENKVGMWRQYQLLHIDNMEEHEEWQEWNAGLLRNDPDVILQGEIRNGKLLNVAIDMAVTGHLVFATLHADDAVKAVFRMKRMKDAYGEAVDIDLLSSILLAIQAQRLLARLCPVCKIPLNEKEKDETLREIEDKGLTLDEKSNYHLFKSKNGGCESCYWTGYRGRLLVYEILKFNSNLIEVITDPHSRIADVEKFIPLHDSMQGKALQYVLNGDTDMEEVYRALRR